MASSTPHKKHLSPELIAKLQKGDLLQWNQAGGVFAGRWVVFAQVLRGRDIWFWWPFRERLSFDGDAWDESYLFEDHFIRDGVKHVS